MRRLMRLGSRGDTIIEVLLSIAVLSMVLSISYGLANRSSQNNRQSQERAEAQKVGEEQLELLRSYVSLDKHWDNSTDICMVVIPDDPSTPGVEPAIPSDQITDCQGRGPGGRYQVKITVSGNETQGYVYTIDTGWTNIKGGTDNLALSYKLPATGDIPMIEHSVCNDGIDNDKDGQIDYAGASGKPADSDCAGNPNNNSETNPPPVVVKAACEDGLDNDNDTFFDMNDIGCSDPSDNSEVDPACPPGQKRYIPGGTCVPIYYFWISAGINYESCDKPNPRDMSVDWSWCMSSSPIPGCSAWSGVNGGTRHWSAGAIMTYDTSNVPDWFGDTYTSIPAGDAAMSFCWGNDNSGGPPPSGYRPQLKITFLPSGQSSTHSLSQYVYSSGNTSIISGLNVPNGTNKMQIQWLNDQYGGGTDSNFILYGFSIYRPISIF